jgi:hypothetical protein
MLIQLSKRLMNPKYGLLPPINKRYVTPTQLPSQLDGRLNLHKAVYNHIIRHYEAKNNAVRFVDRLVNGDPNQTTDIMGTAAPESQFRGCS